MKNDEKQDPLKDQKEEKQQTDHTGNNENSPPTGGAGKPLLDDHEEKTLNASYDDEVDHAEHHEEEHQEHQEKELNGQVAEEEEADTEDKGAENEEEKELNGQVAEEEEADTEDKGAENEEEKAKKKEAEEAEQVSVNYALLSQSDLVKLMREKLDHPAKGNMKKEVEGIRKAFFDKQNQLAEEKKAHFLEQGGVPEDFRPVEDPLEGEMKDLLKKYRELKAEYNKKMELSKQDNLVKKQEILDGFRELMEGQENFELTFRKFKDLQRQWFDTGLVPQQNVKDLWDSYNYFVEKFNDYVRINRDLRALDLKKNLELKTQLCERTEALEKEQNVIQAFKTLQKHHARWREIGPVPRENRDEIWERFKKATSQINKKHQEFHSRLKESLHENLEKKASLCEEVESIAARKYESHGAWSDKTKQILEIQKIWKSVGYAPKKDNNAIYARFRKACDVFFGNKAAFYSTAYEEQKENLKLKSEIVERAEQLRNSEEWKECTTELIRLQKKWKEIGPVPRRESDRLWKRFRAACDGFFSRKSKFFEDVDSTFDENLTQKETLIREMDDFSPGEDRKENMKALQDFQVRFSKVGYVPSSKKEWIKEQFRLAQDRMLERVGLDESERSIFRFRNRIKGILQGPRSEMKLSFERDKLVTKLQQLKSDISVWENNIGFFKQSDSSDPTIRGFHEKIESAHERIRVLELKIRILDDMENAN